MTADQTSWLAGFEAGYDLAANLARAQVEQRALVGLAGPESGAAGLGGSGAGDRTPAAQIEGSAHPQPIDRHHCYGCYARSMLDGRALS